MIPNCCKTLLQTNSVFKSSISLLNKNYTLFKQTKVRSFVSSSYKCSDSSIAKSNDNIDGLVSSNRVDPILAYKAIVSPAVRASGKPYPLEKRYKYVTYSTMLINSKVIGLYQFLSPKGEEYRIFKEECKKNNLVCVMVTSKIFRKAIENYYNSLDFFDKTRIDSERRMDPEDLKLLSSIVATHTVLVASKSVYPDTYYELSKSQRIQQDSDDIQKALKFILNKKNPELFPKMFLIGGKCEHKAFSLHDFKSLAALPKISDLRGHLIGYLQAYNAIPQLLSTPKFNLALTLQALEQQQEKEQGTEKPEISNESETKK